MFTIIIPYSILGKIIVILLNSVWKEFYDDWDVDIGEIITVWLLDNESHVFGNLKHTSY